STYAVTIAVAVAVAPLVGLGRPGVVPIDRVESVVIGISRRWAVGVVAAIVAVRLARRVPDDRWASPPAAGVRPCRGRNGNDSCHGSENGQSFPHHVTSVLLFHADPERRLNGIANAFARMPP